MSETPAPKTTALKWRQCDTFECSSLHVPRDYAQPGGAQLTLSLARRPANEPATRLGSIVVNPGGPGASGLEFLAYADAVFPKAVLDRFDIVGFDPRGVGTSTSVACFDQPPTTPDETYPRDAAALEKWKAELKALDAGCQTRSGELLPFVGTPYVVLDLESIRVALGEEKLRYVGFSYGTLIGALYAESYPDRIRAMVLDAPIDPSLALDNFVAGQATGYQRQFDAFLAACDKDAACKFRSGGTARAAFDALLTKLAAKPIDGVTESDLIAVVLAELAQDDRATLFTGLAALEKGDGSAIREMAHAMFDPTEAVQAEAILCSDFATERSAEAYVALATRAKSSSPDFGAATAYQYLACAYWPASPSPLHAVLVQGAPPILVLGATGDPTTPLDWAKAVSAELPGSVLLVRDGGGHVNLGRSSCVASHVERYLIDLEPPPAGVTCK